MIADVGAGCALGSLPADIDARAVFLLVDSFSPSAGSQRGLPSGQNAPASQILTWASPLVRRMLRRRPWARYRHFAERAEREERMYRIWYWAMISCENDGRFVASIPDLGDLAAYGDSDKAAVAHVTDLAREFVRAAV